jgi:hypothetical protein
MKKDKIKQLKEKCLYYMSFRDDKPDMRSPESMQKYLLGCGYGLLNRYFASLETDKAV